MATRKTPRATPGKSAPRTARKTPPSGARATAPRPSAAGAAPRATRRSAAASEAPREAGGSPRAAETSRAARDGAAGWPAPELFADPAWFGAAGESARQAWTDAVQAAGTPMLPPERAEALQRTYLADAASLWNRWLDPQRPTAAEPIADRRFAGADWAAAPGSRFLAELYLLNAKTLLAMAEAFEGPAKAKGRVRFAAMQLVDAMAPSNFLASNPEALQTALKSEGRSLLSGMEQLWNDVQQGHLSQTDESVFEVGRNVATSPGSVVYENAFMQLVEYAPSTKTVHERPLVVVPPCINKFYILDLQPENSFIGHAVAAGHRTFVVSWKNAQEDIAQATWDDYIEQGPIRAIEVARAITGARTVNTLGFCIGGTILATALAVLAARGEKPAESMTLLTTFLDFSDTGVLDIFIDEPMVRLREMTIGADAPGGGSLLKGQELASTFSFLRPNDLVWNYVVANYLKGEKPPAFDLLYWNSDGTNLPGPMYCWYLRNTYLENNLATPGAATVCGEPVDLSAIGVPTFVYGSREDHIVPWQGAYRSTQLLSGDVRFVLGASGHIAGVVNPPAKKKRSHWVARSRDLPADAEAWFAGAEERPGSWWTEWHAWLATHGGRQVKAPATPGNRTHTPIEPAPGRYVREKA
jgi:polyhydroxyalkanoate synthase